MIGEHNDAIRLNLCISTGHNVAYGLLTLWLGHTHGTGLERSHDGLVLGVDAHLALGSGYYHEIDFVGIQFAFGSDDFTLQHGLIAPFL